MIPPLSLSLFYVVDAKLRHLTGERVMKSNNTLKNPVMSSYTVIRIVFRLN
jgi:hypothetical protein